MSFPTVSVASRRLRPLFCRGSAASSAFSESFSSARSSLAFQVNASLLEDQVVDSASSVRAVVRMASRCVPDLRETRRGGGELRVEHHRAQHGTGHRVPAVHPLCQHGVLLAGVDPRVGLRAQLPGEPLVRARGVGWRRGPDTVLYVVFAVFSYSIWMMSDVRCVVRML